MHPSKKDNLYVKIVNLILPLCPILQAYGWGNWDFAYILPIILGIIWIIHERKIRIQMPKMLYVYLLYYLLVFYISLKSISITDIIPLGWIKIFITYTLFFSTIKFKLFVKYYSRICLVCIIFLFLQYIILYVTGINIDGRIPFLPLADSRLFTGNILNGTVRFSSFFSEPALCAQYLIPFIILLIFKEGCKNWKLIIISITAMLTLQSGNAMFGLIIILFSYIIIMIKNSKRFTILKTISLITIILSTGYIFFQSDAGALMLKRQDQLNGEYSEENSGQSGFVRIFRGYFVYSELSGLQKIIGDNNNSDIITKIKKSKYHFLFEEDDTYFNTIQTVLIRTGIIGLVLFLLLFKEIALRRNTISKIIIITLFVLSLMSSMFFTELMCIYLLLAWKVPERKYTKYNPYPQKITIPRNYKLSLS